MNADTPSASSPSVSKHLPGLVSIALLVLTIFGLAGLGLGVVPVQVGHGHARTDPDSTGFCHPRSHTFASRQLIPGGSPQADESFFRRIREGRWMNGIVSFGWIGM